MSEVAQSDLHGRARRWLAAVMEGVDAPVPAGCPGSALIQAATKEDVLALVASRLQAHHDTANGLAGLVGEFSQAAQGHIVSSMLQEAELRALLQVSAELGIRLLLLKGTALAHWAFEAPHLRACSDLDVLVADYQSGRNLADALSRRLGYIPASSGEDMGYEFMCRKPLPGGKHLELDVHWKLVNTPLFAELLRFDDLWQDSIPVPGLGPRARALGVSHALVHACLHRAANLASEGRDTLKWLWDIRMLVEGMSAEDRARLRDLCGQAHCAALVRAGLTAASGCWSGPQTLKLDKELASLPLQGVSEVELLDWKQVQRLSFQAIADWPGRLRWLRDRVFPSKVYMQTIYARPDSGYARLWLVRIGRGISRCLGR
jgi:Uncharacterised nucleotidyltransferase